MPHGLLVIYQLISFIFKKKDAMTKEYDALERCNVGSEAKKPAICSEEKWAAVYRQRS
jgi:hypothetical protein